MEIKMHVDQLSRRKNQNSRDRHCNRQTQARFHPGQRNIESNEIVPENYKIFGKDMVNDRN